MRACVRFTGKFITALVLVSSFAFAQVPQTLSYQGVLTDASGVPVPDGQYSVTFRLYANESGGSQQWGETQSVSVVKGVFNAILGNATALAIPFDRQYWLGVTVSGQAELSPRTILTASPYSLNSQTALNVIDGAITSAKLGPGAVTQNKIAGGVSLPPSGAAGGDLGGFYPDPSVTKIQGKPVSTIAPNTGQVLQYDGTRWAPANAGGSSGPWQVSGSIVYYNGGNVGIGTATPAKALDIVMNSSSNTAGQQIRNIGSGSASLTFSAGQQSYAAGIDPLGQDAFAITTDDDVASGHTGLIINPDGVVALGAVPPGIDHTADGGFAVVDFDGSPLHLLNGNNDNSGYFEVTSVAGVENFVVSNLNGLPGNGYVTVYAGNGAAVDIFADDLNRGVVAADIKNFRIKHPDQPGKEIWYASLEGPEAAAYVRGTAQLVNGKATIPFPEHFTAVANAQGMTVSLTPLSAESQGLAVTSRNPQSMEIVELRGGVGNYEFDWEVKAVRKGYENYRPVRDAGEYRAAQKRDNRMLRKSRESRTAPKEGAK